MRRNIEFEAQIKGKFTTENEYLIDRAKTNYELSI